MKVSDVMSRDIVTVQDFVTVGEVAVLMKKSGFSTYPVVDSNGHLVGLVSERDMLRAVFPDFLELGGEMPVFKDMEEKATRCQNQPVSEIMERDILLCHPDTPILRIGAKMLLNKVHMVPVVDEKIVGIITEQMVFQTVLSKGLIGENLDEVTPVVRQKSESILKDRPVDSGMAAKRAHKRVNVALDVIYQLMDSKRNIPVGTSHICRSMDLSAGGMLVKMPEKLPVGSLLDVQFNLSAGSSTIQSLARVCSHLAPASDGTYPTGLMFLSLLTKDRTEINRLTENK